MQGEAELARRVAFEREQRKWTYEGLASRMTAAGCPIQASAIYKIEKGDPPRRITLDETLAFSQVFQLPLDKMLLPTEVAADAELARLWTDWEMAFYDLKDAEDRASEAVSRLAGFIGNAAPHSAVWTFRRRFKEFVEDMQIGPEEELPGGREAWETLLKDVSRLTHPSQGPPPKEDK